MRADELVSRLELMSKAARQQKAELYGALKEDLSALKTETLSDLLCICENAFASNARKAARAALQHLLKALEGRPGLSAAQLLRDGITLPTLLQVARTTDLIDLPPEPTLADQLLATILSWLPQNEPGSAASKPGAGSRVILSAVKLLGLSDRLPEDAAEVVLRHALTCESQQLSYRQVLEAGELLPEWRPLFLRCLLSQEGATELGHRDLVKIVQSWGAHEDPEVFERIRQLQEKLLLMEESPSDDVGSPKIEDANLLRLQGERVVMVDSPEGEVAFREAVEAAKKVLAEGGQVLVAMDAEWEDPRPLSLLQLAVCHAGGTYQAEQVSVFLVDMLTPPSSEAFDCARFFLRGGGRHQVLVFGAQEDKRRLALSGILPELMPQDSTDGQDAELEDSLGWVDLQKLGWGLGAQPSLKSVVMKELSSTLDKRFQRSRWDRRPLLQVQVEYAALDAAVLLQLYCRCREQDERLFTPVEVGTSASSPSREVQLSRKEEKGRWQRWRALRRVVGPAAAAREEELRQINGDLRFVLHSSLGRLMRKMRGLGLDTLILPEEASSQQLARVALDEDRIVLSRSRKLQLPIGAADRLYRLSCEGADEQLREVIDVFGVEVDPDCICGRCVQCNTWDWRIAGREDVKDNPQVSQKTYEAFEEFWICGGCGKVFWEGGSFEKAITHFRTFLPEERAQKEVAAPQPPVRASSGSSVASDGGGEVPRVVQERLSKVAQLEKYRDMSAQGLSAQRIRTQMVRDGVLQPGGLLDLGPGWSSGLSEEAQPRKPGEPLKAPFSAAFAKGQPVTALGASSDGAGLVWANGTVYLRPPGDAGRWSPEDLRGPWLDRGSRVEIGEDVISGPNNGFFPGIILQTLPTDAAAPEAPTSSSSHASGAATAALVREAFHKAISTGLDPNEAAAASVKH